MKKAIVLAIILLVIGAYLVKSYNNLDLKKPDDLQTFIKIYFGWVYTLGNNIKDISGYATKKEWLPKSNNQSNINTS